jgi:site-specific recombinase XerD
LPINDNLEEMAKQLYDYWFVQFDFPNEEGMPYKSSGGEMVWNEKLKREIPKGWEVKHLGDIIETNRGISYNTSSISGGGVPMINLASFNVNGTYKDAGIKTYNGSYTKEKVLKPFDLVLCNTQQTAIDFSKDIIGKAFLVPDVFEGDIVSSHHINTIKTEDYYKAYIAYLSNTSHFHKYTAGCCSGTNILGLDFNSFSQYKMEIPPVYLLEEFQKIIIDIVKRESVIIKENKTLTKLRDELLPLLMNGQATVNYHLSASFLSSLILYRDQYKFYDMKETIIQAVLDGMRAFLTDNQLELLTDVTRRALSECEITPKLAEEEQRNKENAELLGAFISSKKVEGCSDKTIHYYKSSIEKLIATVKKNVCDISTNDIRCYLAEQQEQRGLSKVTIDNLRRIYSSFFSWLEDEDFITKSPVRRIHKVRTDALVKEVLTDENIEVLRDSCQELRDIAMIDLLLSTGMRVGELVKINREDIDFQERQCIVFGKGNKEREVYFNARTKIHLKKYLEQRTDTNPALFVSLHEPHTRLTISGVEVRLRQLGKKVNLNKVHPHKFRRTLATMAIDKGMPIEQVQKMLGHVKIDTTLHYAMVNQTNVKIAHRKFLN